MHCIKMNCNLILNTLNVVGTKASSYRAHAEEGGLGYGTSLTFAEAVDSPFAGR